MEYILKKEKGKERITRIKMKIQTLNFLHVPIY